MSQLRLGLFLGLCLWADLVSDSVLILLNSTDVLEFTAISSLYLLSGLLPSVWRHLGKKGKIQAQPLEQRPKGITIKWKICLCCNLEIRQQGKGKTWKLLATPPCLPWNAENSVLWVQAEVWASKEGVHALMLSDWTCCMGKCLCLLCVRVVLIAACCMQEGCKPLEPTAAAALSSGACLLSQVRRHYKSRSWIYSMLAALCVFMSWLILCNLLSHCNVWIILCQKLGPESERTWGTVWDKAMQVLPGSGCDKLLPWKIHVLRIYSLSWSAGWASFQTAGSVGTKI